MSDAARCSRCEKPGWRADLQPSTTGLLCKGCRERVEHRPVRINLLLPERFPDSRCCICRRAHGPACPVLARAKAVEPEREPDELGALTPGQRERYRRYEIHLEFSAAQDLAGSVRPPTSDERPLVSWSLPPEVFDLPGAFIFRGAR